jgi:hypothetical protein
MNTRGGDPERIGDIIPRVLRAIADRAGHEALLVTAEALESRRAKVRNRLACECTTEAVEAACAEYLDLTRRLRKVDAALRGAEVA